MSDVNFYKKLKTLDLPVSKVFETVNFTNVPGDWHVIIADVKNSTAAVTAGKHNDVNLVAAGCLITALNIARNHNIQIPFFFGGDGGTVLVPSQILDEVISGLNAHNINSKINFKLEMHVGSISVHEILSKGHTLKIARMQMGKGFNKAIVLGNGFKIAENIIKEFTVENKSENVLELNMEGLECRWDKIKPPVEENEIVCYLIEAIDHESQLEVYREVLIKIDEIYGSVDVRNPLTTDRLKLVLSFEKFKNELKAKYGRWKFTNIAKLFFNTYIGRLYFRYNWKVNNLKGNEYLNQLINNADTLTIDGRINTIITGMQDKRIKFIEYLTAQQKDNKLIFGHHISRESVMTCYIENRNAKHIHFVDGADGGYTEAAKEIKMQQQKLYN